MPLCMTVPLSLVPFEDVRSIREKSSLFLLLVGLWLVAPREGQEVGFKATAA